MLHGLYTAATGMVAQETRLDSIANNLANISTPGFRRQITAVAASPVLFQQALAQNLTQTAEPETPATPRMPDPMQLSVFGCLDMTAGPMRTTGSSTDLALRSEGYFTLATPDANGTRMLYTRNGSFHLDAQSCLVNAEGMRLLGQNGNPIVVNSVNWSVQPDGRVLVDGRVTATLRIMSLAPGVSTDVLQHQGNGCWAIAENQLQPADPKAISVVQGAIEGSNVNAIAEMVQMITITRQYETNQRFLQAQDGLLDRIVNEIGRV